MRLRAFVLVLVCAAAGAQEATEEAEENPLGMMVDRILRPVRRQLEKKPPADDARYRDWADEYEYQRKKAVRRIKATIKLHGPGGEGKRLDVAPLCAMLLSRELAPSGDGVWKMAEELLKVDPASPSCWLYAREMYRRTRAVRGNTGPPWDKLRSWAYRLRRAAGIEGEASLAVELVLAHVAYETGDKTGARRMADTVLAGGSKSQEMNDAAAMLKSRASLLEPGRAAPSFKIGKVELEEYRGRTVLLHFWDLAHEDDTLRSVVLDCAEFPKSQLAIINIPLADKAPGDQLPGITTEAGHVGRDVARAYGVAGISALFLVSADGVVLAGDGWKINTAVKRVNRLITESMGPPIETRLTALTQTGSWPEFRTLWHGLRARKHTRFVDETWAAARRLGMMPYLALALASATDRPIATQTLHGKLARAWCKLRREKTDAAWKQVTAPLAKADSDECLAVVDAIYDLGLTGDEVRVPLERIAVRAKRWQIVSMALRALQFQDTEATPKALRRQLRHKVWQVRLALAEGLQAYRHKHGVDILIALLGDKRMRVRAKATDVLEVLTNQSLGASQKLWAKWRRAQGTDLRLRPRVISLYKPFRPPDRKYAHRGYYGVQITSDRVVFVLDKSDSMYYGLFDGVVEEMQAHLSSAGPTSKFNVIEFAGKPIPWGAKLVPANPVNINAAVKFLHRKTPFGPTNVIGALRAGLATPGLDSVVLLSDGLPNRGEPSRPDLILAAVRKENRYTRVAIHTVQLLPGRQFKHDDPKGKDVPPLDDTEKKRRAYFRDHAKDTELGAFLYELARQHDGTFGVGFADQWAPPPGATFRDNSDD